MTELQTIRTQEEFAASVIVEKAAAVKTQKQAVQKAILARISQLKKVCICRLICRGEILYDYSRM